MFVSSSSLENCIALKAAPTQGDNRIHGTRWQYPYLKCDRLITSVAWKQGFTQIRSFLVTWCSFSIVKSSLSSAIKRTGINEWMEKYMWGSPVWKLKVIASHLHCLLQSAVSLNLRSSSAPRSRVLFHCEVAYLSLAVWAACLAWPLSLHFLAPWFRSLSVAARRDFSLISGPSPISSDFMFLC